jgi:anti-sigma B factor antagonist
MEAERSARMRADATPFTDFAVHVAPVQGGGTDVAIFGELDLATLDKVEAALDEAIAAEGPVVIDLRACGFVDSRGIATLVKAALRLRDLDRDLVIQGVQERVMRTFELAGITSMEHMDIRREDSPEQS